MKHSTGRSIQARNSHTSQLNGKKGSSTFFYKRLDIQIYKMMQYTHQTSALLKNNYQ
jgi:hypothetical protein